LLGESDATFETVSIKFIRVVPVPTFMLLMYTCAVLQAIPMTAALWVSRKLTIFLISISNVLFNEPVLSTPSMP